MTVGPVAWEWVAFVVALAVCGAVTVAWQAVAGIRQACRWVADWLQGRVDPPWWWKPWLYRRAESYDEDCDHEYTFNESETYEWCQKCDSVRPRECHWGAAEFDLPPERSREELGFTWDGHFLRPPGYIGADPPPESWTSLLPGRERRAPWWEAEHRAAYESLGFDYPSGLMARVRELAP